MRQGLAKCLGPDCEKRARSGSKRCKVCQKLLRVEIVPAEPLREHYLKLDHGPGSNTIVAVCRYMQQHGFPYMRVQNGLEAPDSTRLRRQLGLTRTSADKRTGNPGLLKEYIAYDEAVALSRAFGMAPHEAGV